MQVMNLKNLFVLILLLSTACASSQKSDQHLLRKIILYNLHYRRPLHRGASFNAEPLESDFESKPKPDSKLDCEPLKSLFSTLDLGAVRKCLNSISDDTKAIRVSYKLKREIAPFFILEENKETPACFKKVLGVIPVPREVYFQAVEGDSLSCYSSRIPLVVEETLGISNYLTSIRLSVDLPLTRFPEGDEETVLLMGTWIVAPFFNGFAYIDSKIVPESLCSTCFGGKGLLHATDPLPPFWP
jgi:hypothetical protein